MIPIRPDPHFTPIRRNPHLPPGLDSIKYWDFYLSDFNNHM